MQESARGKEHYTLVDINESAYAALTHLEIEEGAEEKAEYVERRKNLPKEVIHPGRAEELQLPPNTEQG